MSNILQAFNTHFIEFIEDIQSVFPEDIDILTAKNSILAVKQANPRMIIKIWDAFIVQKYKNEIEAGNIGFFINKDYANDIATSQNSDKIMASINRLRGPISKMTDDNQHKTMTYIQNLTKLTVVYTNSK